MLNGMADFFIGDVTFAAALGFLAGIFMVSFGWNIVTFIFCVILVFPILKYGVGTELRTSAVLAAVIFFASFAGIYYFHFFSNWSAADMRLPDGKSSFREIVINEPVASEKYLSFSAKLQPPFSGNISMFAPLGSDIRYGDLITTSGTILPPRSEGDVPAAFPKSIEIVSRGNGFLITEKLLDFKSSVEGKLDEFLPQDAAALLGGMTLGGTPGMSASLKNEMTASETLYVTSMYGYKITIIVAFIEVLLAGFVARRTRFCIAACVMLLFILMSGGNVSAMRGGVMAGALMLAQETGSIFSKRNALVFAAAGIAMFNPTVVQQAGFLFSFASVAGMMFLAEPIRKFLRLGAGNGMLGWKQAIILSVSSLVPIVPLVSAMFGSFSLTAIFANVLIAPVIPLGMTLGAVLAGAGFISSDIAFFIARMASIILDYALWVIRFFAAHVVPLPFSFSGASSFALYYAAVALFAYAYREKRRRSESCGSGNL